MDQTYFLDIKTLSFYYLHCRLKELLRGKLIECGWRDQLKAHCKGKNRFWSDS